MIQQLLTICRHTFVASLRQPILVALLGIATLALVLNPALAAYTLDDDNKLLIDMGLSTLFLTGLLMAAFTATGVLGEEVEGKTAVIVVSKPVARPVFVLGKYLGVTGAIAVVFWALCGIFLLTVRHRVMQTAVDSIDGPVLLFGAIAGLLAMAGATLANYFYHRDFTSSFVLGFCALITMAWVLVLLVDKQWQFQSPITDLQPQIMIGLLLVFEAVLILTAVATVASTRLGQLMTLIVCIGGFVLGLLNDYMFGQFAQTHPVAMACHMVMPNLQLFWPADALTQGHPFNPAYVGLVTAYAWLYTSALLGLAVALFQYREIS